MSMHPDVILYPANFDFSKQSIELPGSKRPGQSGIYRNAAWPELISCNAEKSRPTLYHLFESGLAHSPDKPCLGYRPLISANPLKFAPYYSWESYSRINERRRHVGSALEFLWKQGRAGGGEYPTVGLWSQNRPEWQVVDLAVQAYAKVSVSLYDTLGPGAVGKSYICNHAEVSIVFVTGVLLPSLLTIAPRLKLLKVVVSLDELSEDTRRVASAWASHCGLEFFTLKELEALGQANIREPIIPTPNQVYSLCYTSGTTGNPKGVVLTHGQCATAVISATYGVSFYEPGSIISYLPLAHIYGRVTELLVLNLGGAVGYFTGDPTRLLEDMQILRPTFFPSVPRVLNRIYQAVNAAGNVPGIKGDLFRRAVDAKLANVRTTGQVTHALWDRLVFRKVKRVLGGRVENLTTGSAPISGVVVDFLKIAFACHVHIGKFFYGMTETAAICSRTVTNDPTSSGTVGPPSPGNEIKLVDVPTMGYTSQDKPNPRGEICSRGAVNFITYYKDPKNTSATIDSEGWLHTGDIGEIDPYGRFKIIDRVKNIMKLSQGEYVALEKIESAYSASPIVAQIYVHGDSLQDHLIAVVVPDMVYLADLTSKLQGKRVSPDDLVALAAAASDERVNAAILSELTIQAKKMGLKGFESVKKIHVSIEPFTLENDTLTPSMKIKRREAHKLYKDVLDALYKQPVGSVSVKL